MNPAKSPYAAPRLTTLGTLTELTLGGNVNGTTDGYGASGDTGSIGGPTIQRVTPGTVRRISVH